MRLMTFSENGRDLFIFDKKACEMFLLNLRNGYIIYLLSSEKKYTVLDYFNKANLL